MLSCDFEVGAIFPLNCWHLVLYSKDYWTRSLLCSILSDPMPICDSILLCSPFLWLFWGLTSNNFYNFLSFTEEMIYKCNVFPDPHCYLNHSIYVWYVLSACHREDKCSYFHWYIMYFSRYIVSFLSYTDIKLDCVSLMWLISEVRLGSSLCCVSKFIRLFGFT